MKTLNRSTRNLLIGLGTVIAVVVIVSMIGLYALKPEPEVISGEVSASEYRVSNKVPGRLDTIYVKEGARVKEGDTIAYVSSPEVDAKMMQAKAARSAATAQSSKAKNGARQQQVEAAKDMWEKAKVGEEIAKKSYDRVQGLYEKQVVTAQKRDEVEAQYRAAVATASAARQQYEMALEGARAEDRMAAQALVAQATGAVTEVQSYIDSRYLLAPCNGEVVDIYPKRGELVGTGSPVMSILDMGDVWFTFSIREDLLKGMQVGSEVEVEIPALGKERYKAQVKQIKAMASYATWRATKMSGQYDVKSFDVKVVPTETIEGMRPGMTVLLK
ncbi:MAG: efflux RND transporter periplasmic adaptor subunit [Bacteroidales bacterium]|nr:efflux RND transporter periplasmic adaptor subunit [Bacteroidales bacterium]